MDCFIGKFITKYSAGLGKEVNFNTSKDVKIYILDLLKKNQNSKFSNEPIYQNKLQLICNILFETSYDNIELQKLKKNIIIDLILGKKIDIGNEEKKIISALDKSVLILRTQIIQIIKEGINDSRIEEDPLNEILFFKLLDKEKEIIHKFISQFRIRRIKYENNIFNNILCEYKSFDLKALTNIYKYLSNFNEYYTIYNLFIGLINNIVNILQNNKIINNKINLNYLYNLMDDNIHFISLGFRKLNNNIESMKNEMKKLKKDNEKMKIYYDNEIRKTKVYYNNEIEKIKKDNEKMKVNFDNKIQRLKKDADDKIQRLKKDNDDKIQRLKKDDDDKIQRLKKDDDKKILGLKEKIKNLTNDIINNKKDLDNLKNKLLRISDNLKCPISQNIINEPVITPSGITYEKEEIIRWLIGSDVDPVSRQYFSLDQLVPNLAIKNIIHEFNKK